MPHRRKEEEASKHGDTGDVAVAQGVNMHGKILIFCERFLGYIGVKIMISELNQKTYCYVRDKHETIYTQCGG